MSVPLTAKQIFDAARAGDELALKVVEQEGYKLALAVATIAAVLDPEIVVLGGGVGRNVDLLSGPIERRLHEITPIRPRVVGSALGEDGVLLGAIATALVVARDYVFQQHAKDTPPPTKSYQPDDVISTLSGIPGKQCECLSM